MDKGKIPFEKRLFLKNAGLFIRAREKILNNFKSKISPMKNPDKTPTPDTALEPTMVFDTPKPTKEQT